MKVNYGIVVELNGEVIHMVGYTEQPTENDFVSFYKELYSDKEFGIPISVLDKTNFRHATEEELKVMNEMKDEDGNEI